MTENEARAATQLLPHLGITIASTATGVADSSDRIDGPEAGVDLMDHEDVCFGGIIADRVTREIGSWRFILVYFALLLLWMVVNTVAWIRQWDPYPFIFLNLVLSFQGAFAAPILLMSQNRQEAKDRFAERCDHATNLQAEQEVLAMRAQLVQFGTALQTDVAALHNGQQSLQQRLDALQELLERNVRG
jgi:uncharacterized membrane protein